MSKQTSTLLRFLLCRALLIIVFVPLSLFSQSKYQRGSIAFHFGTTQYQGELQNDFFRFGTINPFNGLSYTHYTSPLVDLKGSIFMGSWGYNHEKLNSFDTDVLSVTLEGKIKLRRSDNPLWMPYLFGGIGAQHYSNWVLLDNQNNPITTDPKGNFFSPSEINGYQSCASLGAGFQFFFAERVFLSFEERLVFPGLDIADGLEGNYPDKMLMHTLSIGFGLFTWKDGDGDLVSDKHDKCPDTPRNVVTDEHGCPLDADMNGLPD